jgi:hypothetical protein
VHLDLYLIRDSNPVRWRTEDLQRAVATRLDQHEGPLIIEGMMLLEALAGIGRKVSHVAAYLAGRVHRAVPPTKTDWLPCGSQSCTRSSTMVFGLLPAKTARECVVVLAMTSAVASR